MRNIVKKYEDKKVRDKIEANIKKNRCGEFTIKIKTETGKVYQNEQWDVKQLSHDFKFGANCFMLDELETKEKNEIYKETFARLFNMATLPFYWSGLEPERGKPRFSKDSEKVYRRPAIDLALEFCDKHNIATKGHCLNYEPFIPAWAKELEFNEYKSALEERIKIIGERYGDKIHDFEVMNEIFQEDKPWETPLRKDVEWSFLTARKYFKNNKLIINEGQNVYTDYLSGNAQYFDLIQDNIKKGIPIDGVGIQSHMMWCPKECADPYAMWAFFEKYEKLNLPLSITEVTVPGSIDGKVDDELQAEIVRNLYSLWFGIGKMDTIVYWNLIDGYDHNTIPGDMTSGTNIRRGGILNFDLSKKKSYQLLDDLINKEWKTNLKIKTDCDGKAKFVGFYGKYELSTTINGKKIQKVINLTKNTSNKELEIEI